MIEEEVVICLKIRTFVVATTTQVAINGAFVWL